MARAPLVRNACDLDLLSFLYRHPHMLLTSEQVAGFIGYHASDVARAFDAFIEAGLLERTAQQSMHAARLFVLRLPGGPGGGVRALLEAASTREGRERILQALKAQGSRPDQPRARQKLRLVAGLRPTG
ncbi:MAG TPA: hypothetical protein VF265_05045 [Nevskiaceae bacterium]